MPTEDEAHKLADRIFNSIDKYLVNMPLSKPDVSISQDMGDDDRSRYVLLEVKVRFDY